MESKLKRMTRSQYYAYKGLSGSNISRPDDPVDEEFIKHVNQLASMMNNMIEQFKGGNNTVSIEALYNTNSDNGTKFI